MEKLLVLIFLLLSIAIVSDMFFKIIPNLVNLSLLFFTCIFSFMNSNIEYSLILAGVLPLPLILIYAYVSDFLKKEVLGFGDIKLSISLGIMLANKGYSVFFTLYTFYFISFVSAAVFSIFYILIYKSKNDEIAFAPFLSLAFFTIYFM